MHLTFSQKPIIFISKEIIMKKIIATLAVIFATAASQAADQRVTVTQSAGKGSSHERIVSLITDGFDKNNIKFEYTAGRNCVPAVQAWNDAKKDPVVMVYSSTSPRLSEQTGIPCGAQPDPSVKIYMLAMASHYVCRHTDSKPITSSIKISIAEAQKNVIDIAKDSGYDWKFVPGTSAQGLLMLANKEVDWAFINTTFGDEKIRAVPGVSCEYIADPDSKTHKVLQSVVKFKEDVVPFLNPVAVVMSKNLSDTQHQTLRKVFSQDNTAYATTVYKSYIQKDLPKDADASRFYKDFFEYHSSVGRKLKK